jgi:hypothetical protein
MLSAVRDSSELKSEPLMRDCRQPLTPEFRWEVRLVPGHPETIEADENEHDSKRKLCYGYREPTLGQEI